MCGADVGVSHAVACDAGVLVWYNVMVFVNTVESTRGVVGATSVVGVLGCVVVVVVVWGADVVVVAVVAVVICW